MEGKVDEEEKPTRRDPERKGNRNPRDP